MSFLERAWKEAWETAKGTFREATFDAPIIGPVLGVINVTESLICEWEEVKTPRGFFGTSSRGREIGMIRANRPDIQIMGISDDGFYVEKGKKSEAIAYLRSVNLKAD